MMRSQFSADSSCPKRKNGTRTGYVKLSNLRGASKKNAPYRKMRSIFRYGVHQGASRSQTSQFPVSLE